MINSKYQNPQSLVLRFMREKRKLTLALVAKEIGIKAKDVDYIEKGIRIASEEETTKFLNCYNFSIEVFTEMVKIKPLTKQAANHYFLIKT
jgi:transcriptional regulator with XRE-family HTH domain